MISVLIDNLITIPIFVRKTENSRLKRRCPDYTLTSADGDTRATFDLKTKSTALKKKTTIKSWFFKKHYAASRKYDHYAGTVCFYKKEGAAAANFKLLTKSAMDAYKREMERQAARRAKK
jgi:hypothetical protein